MTRVFWLLQHVSDVPEDDAWLSASEHDTLVRLWAPKRRRDWRLGRWTAKRALARVGTACIREADLASWPRVSIRPDAAGAPCAVDEEGDVPWCISLSHSGELGLCAVATPPVALGCDVERIGRRGEEFVIDWFTAKERAIVLAAGTADAQSRAVTLIWSAKESALKALGVGLRLDTRQVEVDLSTADLVPTSGSGDPSCRPAVGEPGGAPLQGWRRVRVQAPDRLLDGWWQSDAERVVTIVADPPPNVPVAL